MFAKKIVSSVISVLFLGITASSAFAAKSIEANLSNDTAQVEFDTKLASTSNLYVNGSLLYTEEDDNHSAIVGTLGFQGVETNNKTYRAAVGGRLYFYDYSSLNGAAVAVGGMFYHTIPGAQRLSAGGYGWFAPQVTSFGNTEQIYELGGRVAFRVIQNTDVFVGYRYLKLKHEKSGVKFNDPLEKGPHVGFRLNF
ncbi:YfaZ family outer membrane protein [Marinospirillum insulare]|uniref:YfaZ n=1 Tax=Marinospirillum insulare TaxID=217169 RepID=A0ABQ5ZZG4_9GAMM|nr:YfaZ family outer membrane protein [Marinospirillum insulare]GLR64901.1 hypothetical protein GCM10007878_23390 [Marinospirillum insulare]